MTEVTGTVPVLLLDDAFSELDEGDGPGPCRGASTGQAILTTAGELPPGASPELVVQSA